MGSRKGAAETHPLYSTWREMRRRCENPKRKDYPRYGAKGIRVCERWRQSFWNFYADMGDKPSPDLTLDRIDTFGNYEPENCRWASLDTQLANRRPTVRKPGDPRTGIKVEIDGKTHLSVRSAAKAFGIHPMTVLARLGRGMTPQDAFTAPRQKTGPKPRA